MPDDLTPKPWPITRCPHCRGLVAAEPDTSSRAWVLHCVNCAREWADWNGTRGCLWQPTAAMRQVLAARGLAPPIRPGALPLPTGDAGCREAA